MQREFADEAAPSLSRPAHALRRDRGVHDFIEVFDPAALALRPGVAAALTQARAEWDAAAHAAKP